MDERSVFVRSVARVFVVSSLTASSTYAQADVESEGESDETTATESVGESDSEESTSDSPQEPSVEMEGNGDVEESSVKAENRDREPPEPASGEGSDEEDELGTEEDPNVQRPQSGEPALTDASGTAPLEDQTDWLKWPFSKRNQEYPRQSEPHRWASLGGFVGWVHRSSGSDAIKYRPGIAWGGYLRPELVSWMGLRLFYREERIPAEVEAGAFDYGDDSYEDEFEQPDLQLLNLGARLEPTLVLHPRVRLRGIAGWSWLWFRAPYPRSDDFELKRTFRQAVQMDFSFGLGASLDIIQNWIDVSIDSTYSLPAGRTGSAYEPAQIVRDGSIRYIAPLPELQNSLDVLISLGVIL